MIDEQAVAHARAIIMQALEGDLDGRPGMVTAASTVLILISDLQVIAELRALREQLATRPVTVVTKDTGAAGW